MIADIFYPIFTLTIAILACFIRKKSKIVQGFAYMRSPRHCPGPHGRLKAPPIATASIVFGFAKNQCAHIFSVLSPDYPGFALWHGLCKLNDLYLTLSCHTFPLRKWCNKVKHVFYKMSKVDPSLCYHYYNN